jgi:DNA-binding beta-propeller fold protein YncE
MTRLSRIARLTRLAIPVLALLVVCTFVLPELSQAQSYKVTLVVSGLNKPTGLAIDDDVLYFTEVPTPGVPGGMNAVKQLDLEDKSITTLHMGEPQPVNIAVGRDGSIYWACLSAGVILKRDPNGVTTEFITGLPKPSGIAVDRKGTLYFTEVPTPGVPGGANGVFSTSDGGVTIETLHMGEPEPVEITVARNGDLYWACRSAGVILKRSAKDGTVSEFITGLTKPTGITIDREGRNLYFTEVPTPGVSGANGGSNKVSKYDLRTGETSLIHFGDPQPNAVAVASDGTVYWTCTSAGVILKARPVRCDRDDED